MSKGVFYQKYKKYKSFYVNRRDLAEGGSYDMAEGEGEGDVKCCTIKGPFCYRYSDSSGRLVDHNKGKGDLKCNRYRGLNTGISCLTCPNGRILRINSVDSHGPDNRVARCLPDPYHDAEEDHPDKAVHYSGKQYTIMGRCGVRKKKPKWINVKYNGNNKTVINTWGWPCPSEQYCDKCKFCHKTGECDLYTKTDQW